MTAPTALRRRRTPRMSGDDREQAILETASELLRERPLHDISIDELARGAGITRPGFYFYFASKDGVLLALLQRMADAAVAARDAALARYDRDTTDPAILWRASIEAFYQVWKRNRDLIRSVAIARATSIEVRDLWSAILGTIVEDTATAIEEERAKGTAPAGIPARDLAACLSLMCERVFASTLGKEDLAVPDGKVVDSLLQIHLLAVYGTAQ